MIHKLRFVYVMQLDDCIKVGMATSPINRARNLSRETGRDHRLHRVYDCKGWARHVERPVLEALSPYRIKGEYFSCSAGIAEVEILARGAVLCDYHQDNVQTQIRMTPENRERFRATAEAMGLSAEELVMAGIDALSRRNQPTNKELLAMLKERLG